jgi:hypothetical protein
MGDQWHVSAVSFATTPTTLFAEDMLLFAQDVISRGDERTSSGKAAREASRDRAADMLQRLSTKPQEFMERRDDNKRIRELERVAALAQRTIDDQNAEELRQANAEGKALVKKITMGKIKDDPEAAEDQWAEDTFKLPRSSFASVTPCLGVWCARVTDGGGSLAQPMLVR